MCLRAIDSKIQDNCNAGQLQCSFPQDLEICLCERVDLALNEWLAHEIKCTGACRGCQRGEAHLL